MTECLKNEKELQWLMDLKKFKVVWNFVRSCLYPKKTHLFKDFSTSKVRPHIKFVMNSNFTGFGRGIESREIATVLIREEASVSLQRCEFW